MTVSFLVSEDMADSFLVSEDMTDSLLVSENVCEQEMYISFMPHVFLQTIV